MVRVNWRSITKQLCSTGNLSTVREWEFVVESVSAVPWPVGGMLKNTGKKNSWFVSSKVGKLRG